MFKWVTTLCVVIYATLMIFGGEGYTPETKTAQAPVVDAAPVTVSALPEVVMKVEPAPQKVKVLQPETADKPAVARVAPEVTETVVESSIAAIAPVATPAVPNEVVIASVVTRAAVEVASIAPTQVSPAPVARKIYTVTGSRVNLRALAGTNGRVVGRTVRGETAEVIEMLPNGWAKVYIIDTGIEAYMSARFIEPVS